MVGTEGWVTGLEVRESVGAVLREALLITLETGWSIVKGYGPTLLAALAAIGVTVGIAALTFAVLGGLP